MRLTKATFPVTLFSQIFRSRRASLRVTFNNINNSGGNQAASLIESIFYLTYWLSRTICHSGMI